ncbi:MAG: hypothetical protein GX786_00230, partial [Clostridiales bacterium]|nr:hypothetical protein [Clostridiales bacterium]
MPEFETLTVAYIEEDPQDKTLFRLKPLYSEKGPYSQEYCLEKLPDHGYLRIVPDKKEKSTFKNRIRKVMPLALVRLSEQSEEKSKIKPNRKYSPDEKEHNQYVIYSDAIESLPKDYIYEVLTIPTREKISVALEGLSFLTPKGYIQRGNDWYGPFSTPPKKLSKKTPRPPSYTLFSSIFSNSGQHFFYFPILEEILHANQTNEKEASLPIGKSLDILDTTMNLDEQIATISQPLSQKANFLKATENNLHSTAPVKATVPGVGTPLYPVASINKNDRTISSLDQIVVNQLRSKPLSTSKASRNSNLDLDNFSSATLAKNTTALSVLLKQLLLLPNFKEGLKKALADIPLSDWENDILSTFKHQLDSLEAERFSIIMQLDNAKADLDQFTAQALTKMRIDQKESIHTLTTQIETLEKEKHQLLEEEKVLQSSSEQLFCENRHFSSSFPFLSGSNLLVRQKNGKTESLSHVVHHVLMYMQSAGFSLSQKEILALLYAIASNKMVGFVCDDQSISFSFIQTFLNALSLHKQQIIRKKQGQYLSFSSPTLYGTPIFILYDEYIDEFLPEYCIGFFTTSTSNEQASLPSYQKSP